MTLSAAQLYDLIDATWPAAQVHAHGPWNLREGRGGGKRVSAATATQDVSAKDVLSAQKAMENMGQTPLFMIRQGEEALDHTLQDCGYGIVDPVVIYTHDVLPLLDVDIPKLSTFCIWEPLEIMKEIWARGGIGPQRLAVMERVRQKTSILGRWNNHAAGACFAARHLDACMVHALEVEPSQRRNGLARWMMHRAAHWAHEQGAKTLAVLCTQDNLAANALYQGMGFSVSGHYHYRQIIKG